MTTNKKSFFSTLAVGLVGGAIGAGSVVTFYPSHIAVPSAVASAATLPQSGSVTPQGDAIADLVEKVGPAVVNIDTISREVNPMANLSPFFRGFGFFDEDYKPYIERKGVGSGFIIETNGLVVTNFHVVKGAKDLKVTLPNGKKYQGKIVGQDPDSDLALVKIEAKGLPFLELADPNNLRVGQWVVAIGSPLGLQHSVTAGILSAVNRDIDLNRRVNFLQTDAPINPGNSGGPLLNMTGQVIGVNTAVASQAQGIGFAVPVNTLREVLPQLKAHGKTEKSWIGVDIRELPEDRSRMFYPSEYGVLIARVVPKSPAAKAGLQPGDVIQKVDGKEVKTGKELINSIISKAAGTQIQLVVAREGQTRSITLKVEHRPEQVEQQEQEQGNPIAP